MADIEYNLIPLNFENPDEGNGAIDVAKDDVA